jgi:sulfate adenylyltransferase subunit 2
LSSHQITSRRTHLKRLEAESIHIMLEVAAEFSNPVMLRLALKAFYPSKPPFPFLHVDTNWKFREMIKFRDETVSRLGLNLPVHINQDG